ncbi:MAG: carboxylating nicotinate-nucleotide diphosphorylase [Mariprofundaceae bacterium]|nr:carboxylating nicotinate-nucleotide diphosphorylase [Mariprofundaceae bacterium]
MDNVQQLIHTALEEDMAFQDITGLACIAVHAKGTAKLVAKATGVLSGCDVSAACFQSRDASLSKKWFKHDGDTVQAGDVLAHVSGSLRSLLAAERTALNFLQHLSGIATTTHAFVCCVDGTGCQIVDTRKTTPGMRQLEKQAVQHGGGVNHRMDLADAMLIKENHIAACGSISDAVGACYTWDDRCFVEVECETLAQVTEAVLVAPDMILLDNMTVAMVKEARALVPDSILLEASGNINLDNAKHYAATGVNRLAIGAMTHSSPVLDVSLLIVVDN